MAMKRTLLEMTQDILVSINGDEITDIADTTESAQVAAIIRQCFYDIASNWELPEHFTLFELTETSSSTPTVMTKPTDVVSISWIKYNNKLSTETASDYQEVRFLPNKDFFDMILGMDSEDVDNISRFTYTVGSDSFEFPYVDDQFPQWYTTFDDSTIVFDSFNSEEETFLRKPKTMCWGLKESSWTHSSSAVPNLDHRLSNLLFQTARAQAWLDLNQTENPDAERKVRRNLITLTKKKHDINAANRGYYYNEKELPNYGWKR